MKRKIAIALCLFALYLGFVVYYLPAAAVWRFAPHPPAVAISSIEGRLWQGSAQEISWNDIAVESVRWEFGFLPLFLGNVNGGASFGHLGSLRGKADFSLGMSDQQLSDVSISLPLDKLTTLIKLPLPIELSGEARLTLADVAVDSKTMQCQRLVGQLKGIDVQASSAFGGLDLGSIQGDVSCDQGMVNVKLQQNSDQLRFDGSLQLSLMGSYKVSGIFIPQEKFPEPLKGSLKWVGKLDDKGRYHLNYQGHLS